jgi:hypothetical protein
MLSEGYQDGFRDGWSDQRDGRKPTGTPKTISMGGSTAVATRRAFAPMLSDFKAASKAAPVRRVKTWRDSGPR